MPWENSSGIGFTPSYDGPERASYFNVHYKTLWPLIDFKEVAKDIKVIAVLMRFSGFEALFVRPTSITGTHLVVSPLPPFHKTLLYFLFLLRDCNNIGLMANHVTNVSLPTALHKSLIYSRHNPCPTT